MLYKLQADKLNPSSDVLATVLEIEDRIKQLVIPSSTISSPQKWHVLQAWRLGILLYSRNLFRANEDTSSEILSMTSAIFSHAKTVPAASGWAYSMLWSLFQSGLALDRTEDGSDREWLRGHIQSMLQAVGCGGFYNALQILNDAWLQYNMGHSRANVVNAILSGPLIIA
jgi:hypothetical protein